MDLVLVQPVTQRLIVTVIRQLGKKGLIKPSWREGFYLLCLRSALVIWVLQDFAWVDPTKIDFRIFIEQNLPKYV